MKSKLLVLFGALALAPNLTHAAIFDAADYREPGQYSLGSYAEFLLNNPSGEGFEIRAKRGINDMVNLEPFVGFGRKNRGFRFGMAAPINFFPNTDSQPGVSLLLTGQYVHRESYKGLNIQAAPMVHKIVDGADHLPLNLYLGFPYFLELYDGHYRTGLQAAFGGIYDASRDGTYFVNTEAGISLNRAESAVMIGGGIRFGTRSASNHATWWNKDEKEEKKEPAKAEDSKSAGKKTETIDESEDYAPEGDE